MKDTGTGKTVQLVFILFYFILFYFILFYSSQSEGTYVALLGHIILILNKPQSCQLRGEATNINFIVVAMTRPEVVPRSTVLEASSLSITPCFFVSFRIFFFEQHESQNIYFFCRAKMTTTLNQIICFSSTKIRIFFSATLGIRIFFLEKTIPPPPFKLNGRSLMLFCWISSGVSPLFI